MSRCVDCIHYKKSASQQPCIDCYKRSGQYKFEPIEKEKEMLTSQQIKDTPEISNEIETNNINKRIKHLEDENYTLSIIVRKLTERVEVLETNYKDNL